MIKFIIEKFRAAPGPLKQPRLILADLAEELLDTARQYMDNHPHGPFDDTARTGGDADGRAPSAGWSEPGATASGSGEVSADGAEKDGAAQMPPPRSLDVDPRLARAMADAGNARKQDFKVLAILWDAYGRGLVPLSAKAVSDHGVQIGLAIRHENVRKVIRMRLEKYVDYHNEGAGTATIYRYALNAAGRDYFDATYLRESER